MPSHHIDDITEFLLVFVSVGGRQGSVSWQEERVRDVQDRDEEEDDEEDHNARDVEEEVTQGGVGHEQFLGQRKRLPWHDCLVLVLQGGQL